MNRSTHFVGYTGDGWPDEKWLARFFLTPQGRRDLFASDNDCWGLRAEGVDGTDHLPHLQGRVDIDLTIQVHPQFGVLLQHRRTGRLPIQTYYSRGDLSRLHEWIITLQDEQRPVGLFIPFEKAWQAIKEFIGRDAALPSSIVWVKGSDLPATAFPPPLMGPNAYR